MYKTFIFALFIITVGLSSHPVKAQKMPCTVKDKLCMMQSMEVHAAKIENKSWRDKTYRELAKSYAYEGHKDHAIALISKIETPDTKAMTIRGIGFAAADSKWKREEYNVLFQELTLEADKIEHAPSQAIAYTYIAMSQAFAHDDEGAMATALAMTNDALRNKAFAETAEIQAERGDRNTALESIRHINSKSFKNKAYATIAKIFIRQNELTHAYKASALIDNTYNRLQIHQMILNKGNPEEEMPSPKTKSIKQ